MAYPFVAAKYFTAGVLTAPRGVAVHMAQGGGTVSWLSRDDGAQGNNSCHFVVEYSGRVVQMVKEADASHSLHAEPRSDWPSAPADFGTFGFGHAKAVLGAGATNPNRYIFAIEIEGFAGKAPTVGQSGYDARADPLGGPNDAQAAALVRLVADLRARHSTIRGNLGHRDFQDYKACPGGLIPWAALGGHGLISEEEDVNLTVVKGEDWTPTTTRRPYRAAPVRASAAAGYIELGQTVRTIAEAQTADGNNWRLTEIAGKPAWLLRSDFTPATVPVDQGLSDYINRVPVPPADCTAAVAAAHIEGRRFEWDIQATGAVVTLVPKP